MITMREINMDIGSLGAEEANSVLHFFIAISLSSTGGSFLRRAGDENISEIPNVLENGKSFPAPASLRKLYLN